MLTNTEKFSKYYYDSFTNINLYFKYNILHLYFVYEENFKAEK